MHTVVVMLTLAYLSGLVQAATRYVATTGVDAPSCENIAAPCATIEYARANYLQSGETLKIAAGTYVEQLQGGNVPDGTSWSGATIFEGAGVGLTILKPHDTHAITFNGSGHDIIYRNFTIDMTDQANGVSKGVNIDGAFHHLRFEQMEFVGGKGSLFYAGAGSDHIEVIDTILHDSGVPICYGFDGLQSGGQSGYCHAFYINGTTHMLIANVKAYDNDGLGVQSYFADNIIIKNTLVYNNVNFGIYVSEAENIGVYNSVVYGGGDDGVVVNGPSTGIVQNMLSYNNAGAAFDLNEGLTVGGNFSADPSFVNAAAGNFRLSCGSIAINTGVTIPIVTDDYAGVCRPVHGGYDAGAYERATCP